LQLLQYKNNARNHWEICCPQYWTSITTDSVYSSYVNYHINIIPTYLNIEKLMISIDDTKLKVNKHFI